MNRPDSLPQQWEGWLKAPVDFCPGFVNGLTGSQVMPSLPYMPSSSLLLAACSPGTLHYAGKGQKRLSRDSYRKLVLVFLLIMGVVLLLKLLL